MNSLLGIISEAENEKIDFFLTRFEEIKKALKLIKGYLIDYSFSGDLFGKTMMKTLKTYFPFFQTLHNDPTFLNNKINEAVSLQESLSKALIAVFMDYPSFVNSRFDEFHEKLNLSRKKLLDLTSVALKNYTNAKAYFYKMKLKFERSCKDCEQSYQILKKTQNDPNTMYNKQVLTNLDLKTKRLVRETVSIEQVLRAAQREAIKKLDRWNKSLLEGFQILMVIYRNSFEKFLDGIDKYNSNFTLFVGGFLKQLKERPYAEISNPKMLLNEEEENLFLEEMKFKEGEAPVNKGLYQELNNRILNNKEPLKDQEVQLHSELAQKHLETYLILVDERRKIYKNLKNLITEISQLIDTFSKSMFKNSKNNSFANLNGSNPYIKRLNSFLETFFASNDSLAKKLNNLSLFMGIKVSTLENILKEHKNYEKILSNTISRSLKDIYTTKLNLTKGIQNYERFMGMMSEAEKLKNDVKYMQNKREAEECHESNKEIISLLRKMVYESAGVLANAYKEFRNHEQLNLQSIKMILEGISSQFTVSMDEVQESIRFCSEFFHKRFDLDTEIKSLITLDSGLSTYENLGAGKMEDEDFGFEGFIAPPEYKEIMLEERKKDKCEVESNVEDNDKFSEKSGEKVPPLEEDSVGTPQIAPKDVTLSNINNLNVDDLLKEKKEGTLLGSQNQLDGPKEAQNQEEKDMIREGSFIREMKDADNLSFSLKDSKENGAGSTQGIELTKPKSNSITKNGQATKDLPKDILKTVTEITRSQSVLLPELSPMKESNIKSFVSSIPELQGESNSEEWKSLENRFNLTAKDKLITSYACAFAQKILLQGRLYVFNTRLCFHSYFNAQTLFGHTKLNIPIEDIIRFEKRTNALFFHNAIAIITKGGELFFASFMNRDATFDLLLKFLPLPSQPSEFNDCKPEMVETEIIPKKEMGYLTDSHKNEVFINEDQLSPKKEAQNSPALIHDDKKFVEDLINSDDALNKKQHKKGSAGENLHKLSVSASTVDPKPHQILIFQERAQRIAKLLLPLKSFKETIVHVFKEANLKDIFISLWSIKCDDLSMIKHKGNNYANFIELLHAEGKDESVVCTDFEPTPPKYYRFADNFDFDELLTFPDFSTFEVNFVHPIKERILFAPKYSVCTDKGKIFWVSHNELIVHMDTHFAKIPFADYFVVRRCYHFKEKRDQNQVEMTLRFFVDFVKSTIFQSKIDKQTTEETKEFSQEMFIPMAIKIHKDFVHRIKEKFGSESLDARVLIPRKLRTSKDVLHIDPSNFSKESPRITSPKEIFMKEPALMQTPRDRTPKESVRHSRLETKLEADRMKEEVKELKEQINELNDRVRDYIKNEEKGRNRLTEEMAGMRNLIWGLLILVVLIVLQGIFKR